MTFQNFKTAPRGRQAAENTMKTDGGVMDEAAEATTELDCFKLFMDESIITDVTELTNRNIQGHLDKLSPEKLKMIECLHQSNHRGRGPSISWSHVHEGLLPVELLGCAEGVGHTPHLLCHHVYQ